MEALYPSWTGLRRVEEAERSSGPGWIERG
jgi:hypothetical protein